uniref:Uncharacterized protein n=1 Tax=Davidia involucrata TaxID=16924 RepID=A0A5B7B7L7_DAVIN
MSSLNLAKKLQHAKKAWKSFTNTLQSKLSNVKIPKAIKKTTNRIITLHRRRCHHHHHHYHNHHQHQKSFAAIYVDQLFPELTSMHAKHLQYSLDKASKAKETAASSSGANKAKETAATMNMQKHKKGLPRKSKAGDETSAPANIADAWKAALPQLQLQGVDERAEEFISKFRQEMKLQREQSIIEFQEMLARSA